LSDRHAALKFHGPDVLSHASGFVSSAKNPVATFSDAWLAVEYDKCTFSSCCVFARKRTIMAAAHRFCVAKVHLMSSSLT
jgi:hypothetical protein